MIALDSSVIVAALAWWHGSHDVAAAVVASELQSRRGLIVAAHALCESYSVLTRLPEPYRAPCHETAEALIGTFKSTKVVGFPAPEIWNVIDDLASSVLAGGIIYDAVILRTVEAAGATTLLTFNPRHFERLNPHIRIQEP